MQKRTAIRDVLRASCIAGVALLSACDFNLSGPTDPSEGFDPIGPTGSGLEAIVGSPVPCEGGIAAGFPCSNVDLLSFLPLGELGSGFVTLNDMWGWTDPQTLIDVAPRLTTGVVATAPAGTGAGSDGQLRFQQAYEEYFHRSLVGKTAAVGYDATLLLLEALRPGRLRPEDVRLSFDGLVDIRGATGLFSVLEGRIVRKTEVVRIDERRPVPIRGR